MNAEAAAASPLLAVRDLTVAFARAQTARPAIEAVGFEIQPGETLAVVGESGSGKSVTALSINRLVDHAGGRIVRGAIRLDRPEADGIDLATASPVDLRRIRGNEIGMIFQEPMTSLNPVQSVGRQVAEALRLHQGMSGHAAQLAARQALDVVRIPDAGRRMRDYPHQLSGGMRQRVMIAMALACRPRLLIADEPTTALDVTIQAQIVALLEALRREIGMAVLFITHDMGLVAEVADRVLVMQGGQVVEQGTRDQILDRPTHPYTRHLLDAVPHFQAGRATRPERAIPIGRDARSQAVQGEADVTRLDGQRVAAGESIVGATRLTVRDLTVRFRVRAGLLRRLVGVVHAVEGVDLDLAGGETVGIVGESGCGKSTLARAILGLVQPDRGKVAMGSTGPVAAGSRARLAQMVFQDPFASLNPRLTVRSLLAEPVIATGRPIDPAVVTRMVGLLARVGLPEGGLERYPHQFSGGERQRLCIARALMTEPAVVILDEAVSALDVSVQAQVLDLLIELQAERDLAYLFISHDMAVIERIAHRVMVMLAGEVVETGPAARVLGQPAHPYTRRLIAAVPSMAAAGRDRAFALDTSEPPSLLRPPGHAPPPARWREVGPGHRVREGG